MYQTESDISDDTLRDRVLSSFPAYMNQEDDSNNQRILNIIADMFTQHKNNLLNISKQRLLSTCSGQSLTDLAADYGINRLDDDDNFLRFQIRFQMMKNRIGITTNDIKQLIAVLLDVTINTFDIVGTDNPEEIEVINVPFSWDSGDKAEVKRTILTNAIQSMLPPEYNLKDLKYSIESPSQLYVGVLAKTSAQVTVKEMA
ncbi:hypothetical protein [Lactobacillus buchneri CD034] [Lactiplantibacillus mudanjiangensis]|uniref:hypothetical protein n=1 Tax=Lactiplantibacillus mudanjiangensis TaxID=1296538 RepID=UPI001013F974|nr:hypothetical protein [Lactiplantibacillus mudanjiangensis]VDG31419.1 hypothetical protein [Lactobacillus buchneri CD034] [Lactiplantibacillus mudanjiangensis]